MTKKLISILISAAACLPLLAHAQGYKCQSPSGAVSFQDHPCEQGAASSTIKPAPPPADPGKAATRKYARPSSGTAPSTAGRPAGAARYPHYPYAREGDIERMKAENAELQARVAQMKAQNPNWQNDDRLRRIITQAEANDARIQAAARTPGC